MPIRPVNQYAGYTPLSSTITVQQTGPLQLTVRAGSFVTIGEAVTLPYPTQDDIDRRQAGVEAETTVLLQLSAQGAGAAALDGQRKAVMGLAQQVDAMRQVQANVAGLIAAGRAELVDSNIASRVRIWSLNQDGSFRQKSALHTLAADQVISVTPDAVSPTSWRASLGVAADGTCDVLVQSCRLDGVEVYADPPAGWVPVHWVIEDFIVPAAATDLSMIEIAIFNVLPGVPADSVPGSWEVQAIAAQAVAAEAKVGA